MSGTHTVMDQGFSIYVPVAVNWAHVIRFTCYGDRPIVVCRFQNKITVQALVPQRTTELPLENIMSGYRPGRIPVYSLSWLELSFPKLIGSTYVKYSSTHDDLLHVLSSHTLSMYGKWLSMWENKPSLDLYDITHTLHSCLYIQTLNLYMWEK